MTKLTRRKFLGYSSATLLSSLFAGKSIYASTTASSEFQPDLEVRLTAAPDKISIRDGQPTSVWRYTADVIKGDNDHIQTLSNSYLGPIFRVKRGQKLRIHLVNQLPEETIIHWHGLHIPDSADGHPRFAIKPQQTFVYDFVVDNRAGTYWYHPHPHGRTGPQVNAGLAGLFIITDDEEQALGLPSGEFDVPLVLQDRSFDRNNQFEYKKSSSSSGMMGRMMGGMMGGNMSSMMGFLGDQMLVNGQVNFTQEMGASTYRLRLLNGSNSRILKLAWSNQLPMTVIGTDGGLLEKPETRPFITLAPAERIDLWLDLSQYSLGTELTLMSQEFESPTQMPRMMSGMMGSSSTALGTAMKIAHFRVTKKSNSSKQLPSKLSTINRLNPKNAINYQSPKRFQLTMQMMQWGFNGRQFDMLGTSDDEVVRLNTEEIWEFHNGGGMMGGMMPHPIHIHGLQFQVIGRDQSRVNSRILNELSPGFVDNGWKDTILVLPEEKVQLQMRFEDHKGLYLYHCHNLEHEDGGMMRNYRVV